MSPIKTLPRKALVHMAAIFLTASAVSSHAAPGDSLTTPVTPMELPVEIEVETGISSLKQAPLWKEQIQLLENPYLAPTDGSDIQPSAVERRPNFMATPLPELNVWPLGYNFLTGQPLRLRTSDGEVSWDLPGPLFDPEEPVATDQFNTPTELRTVIGALIGSDDEVLDAGEVDGTTPCVTCGYLIVSNPAANPSIPTNGTVVAVPAVIDGELYEGEIDELTGDLEFEVIVELEAPVNEEHFLREEDDVDGVPAPLQPFIGRLAAEILGKSLFWDMQIGSDGVQACGTCHFNAGADNRTRNQLNPNHLGGDLTLDILAANESVTADDFPFHKLADPEESAESTSCGHAGLPPCGPGVVSDANDIMSSMGVRFRAFNNIPEIGVFIDDGVSGVPVLPPDEAPGAAGGVNADPIPAFQGVRRVEPRNTPTMHSAAFNFDNFWDGRARFNFNGGSVHGPSDPQFHIFVNNGETDGLVHGLPSPEDNELPLDQWAPEAGEEPVPVRIKFSSLGSQAVGPPLSDFEMSFAGRNWPKIGKKLLQTNVTPLANQLVAVDDSRLGPFSNQGGAECDPADTAVGKPGLCVTYSDLIRAAFSSQLWANTTQRLVPDNNPNNEFAPDPFDDFILQIQNTTADPDNRNHFTQMEANFSLFFGLSVQIYEQLLIPDDTLFDQFMDANPGVANSIGQPGEQGVLYPTLVPGLIGSPLALIPDDPGTPEYDGFGEEELFGFDIFTGGNATAALPLGSARNPAGFGSNPFARTARCMLCHLGPEQTDHSNNIAHGIIKGDAEYEFPTPPTVIDPFGNEVPAPEPPGRIAAVAGLILSEEVTEGAAQDAVEVEPRNFATFDDPDTPWDDRVVAQPNRFSFGDQGVYNVGLRPNGEDIGRGGDDPFAWPLSLSALTLKNIGGADFEPGTIMANFDPADIGAEEPGALQGFEETGDGRFFEGTTYTLQSINPGYERDPIDPQLPDYMVPWMHGLPAGELHPQIDEMAGFAPNTLTPTNGGPAVEFPEVMFGADPHCGDYNPALYGAGAPNYGWGPRCPNNQSGVAGNFQFPVHGSWPDVNQVLKDGAFKAPSLRNVELTGPYFHTGSYLTLRQVVDFYLRGGDFPLTNASDRDPHLMEIEDQAFGFGTTLSSYQYLGFLLSDYFDCSAAPPSIPEALPVFCGMYDYLIGTFGDALPDTDYQYDFYPDSDHPQTPEPSFASRDAALEDARDALVRFLISFTDPRVRYERAPFDRPELFVPIDGAAPDNNGGRAQLVALSATTCAGGVPASDNDLCFRHLPEVGASGRGTPLAAFLEVTNNPAADCVTEISHFCP